MKSSNQPAHGALIETCLNTASGFFLSYMTWVLIVVPLYDLPVTTHDNLSITMIFTVVSIIRGYFWRRIFNKNDKTNRTRQEENVH